MGSAAAAAAAAVPTTMPTSPKPQPKARIGWNPDAAAASSGSAASAPTTGGGAPTVKVVTAGSTASSSSAAAAAAKALVPPSASSLPSPASDAVLPAAGAVPPPAAAATTKPRVGWNPSRLPENGAQLPADILLKCADPNAPARRSPTSTSEAGRFRTESDVATATNGEKGVTLELQALLLFAVERGIDLVKWFQPDEPSERTMAFVDGDLLISKKLFAMKVSGLGVGLGAGQDEDTQAEIAAAVSKGSIDTCARKRNCDAENPHPKTGELRVSMKRIFDVSKASNSLTTPTPLAPTVIVAAPALAPAASAASAAAPTSVVDNIFVAPAKRLASATSSPPKVRVPPPVVNVPAIKPAPPLPLAQKPMWSPSASNHSKATTPFEVQIETKDEELERQIKDCLASVVKQADTYHKLRVRLDIGKQVTTPREVSGRELATAMADVGLKLGPRGVAAIVRLVGTSQSGGVDAEALRNYLLQLKLKKKMSLQEWALQKRGQEEKEQKRKEDEFQKAMHGKRFDLGEEDYDALIRGFELMDWPLVKTVVSSQALEWISSPEGKQITRKSFVETEGASTEEKEAALKAVKKAAMEEYMASLIASEKDEQMLSKTMFRKFVAENKSNQFDSMSAMKFEDWVKEGIKKRELVKETRKKWVAEKNKATRDLDRDGAQVATYKDVEEKIEELVAKATSLSTVGGATVLKPSREGLEVKKKLREMERRSGATKVVSKAMFRAVMHNVVFSLRAAKKCGEVANALQQVVEEDKEAPAGGLFVDDKENVVGKKAMKGEKDKRKIARKSFRKWKKDKDKAAAAAILEMEEKDRKTAKEKEERTKLRAEAHANWMGHHQHGRYESIKKDPTSGAKRVEVRSHPRNNVNKPLDVWNKLSLDENGVPNSPNSGCRPTTDEDVSESASDPGKKFASNELASSFYEGAGVAKGVALVEKAAKAGNKNAVAHLAEIEKLSEKWKKTGICSNMS